MLFRSSFKFFHKTLQGIKSFLSGCGCGNYHKLPKHSPLDRPHSPSRGFRCADEEEEAAAPGSTSRSEARRSREDRRKGKTAKGDGSAGVNGDREGSGRGQLVVRKIRELELLDLGNIEHVLDVEEVIHYYSLLRCQVYRGIVDEFFAEIYVEFRGETAAAGHQAAGG
ncbi:hypothetical protein MLD38_006609 [Melastoma candidum]|uniref:Uncharacterized protein n=1 Tax=Melastoma candidum TaxID=119954 RepID=A0ACB9RNG4_9MYRT|nr:hypothetical protein MLD38_006609 [Melastoma candidum]